MEQKQRKVRANPFGEQEEEEGIPSPPEIDDVLKAAEMAQMNNQPEQKMSNHEPEFICVCLNENCEIGPFIRRSGK